MSRHPNVCAGGASNYRRRGFCFSGFGDYEVGADQPQGRVTFLAVETLRNNSADKRSKEMEVPQWPFHLSLSVTGASRLRFFEIQEH